MSFFSFQTQGMAPLMNLLQTVNERSKTKRGKNSREKKGNKWKERSQPTGIFSGEREQVQVIFLEKQGMEYFLG